MKIFKVILFIQMLLSLGVGIPAGVSFLERTRPNHLNSKGPAAVFNCFVAGFGLVWSTIMFTLVMCKRIEQVSHLMVFLASTGLGILFLNAAVLATLHWESSFLATAGFFGWVSAIIYIINIITSLKKMAPTLHLGYVKSVRGISRIIAIIITVIISMCASTILNETTGTKEPGSHAIHFFSESFIWFMWQFTSLMVYLYRENTHMKKTAVYFDFTMCILFIIVQISLSSVAIFHATVSSQKAASAFGFFCSVVVLVELVSICVTLCNSIQACEWLRRSITRTSRNRQLPGDEYTSVPMQEPPPPPMQLDPRIIEQLISQILERQGSESAAVHDGTDSIPIPRPENPECKVCLNEDGVMALLPCGHYPLCQECANSIAQCHICRRPIQKRVRIFQT